MVRMGFAGSVLQTEPTVLINPQYLSANFKLTYRALNSRIRRMGLMCHCEERVSATRPLRQAQGDKKTVMVSASIASSRTIFRSLAMTVAEHLFNFIRVRSHCKFEPACFEKIYPLLFKEGIKGWFSTFHTAGDGCATGTPPTLRATSPCQGEEIILDDCKHLPSVPLKNQN